MALKLVQEESRKTNDLADRAISFLLEGTGCGDPEFRCFLSPAIQSTAERAFDEDGAGIKLFPRRDSISCLCEEGDDDEHRLLEIERVAKAICRKLGSATESWFSFTRCR